MKKIVSIITPSFNRADVVTETADSIMAQTYPHWEWVIVDDGSTDNSWEVLQSIAAKDKRIKIFKRHRNPKGACVCRNIAVEKSSGYYLMFLDTDDVLAPFCLQQRVDVMELHPDNDFAIFPMLLFKKDVNDMNILWNVDSEEDDLKRFLMADPICQGTGTLWKKNTFKEVGMWREGLAIWQDVELHVRSLLHPVKYTKHMHLDPDVYLRISDDSLSRVGYYSLPKLKSRMTVFFEVTGLFKQKGLLEAYSDALRFVGSNIIKEAIRSKWYTEANVVMKFCRDNEIFTPAEIRQFAKYRNYQQLKLYKLSPLKALQEKLHNLVTIPHTSRISAVPWKNPVSI